MKSFLCFPNGVGKGAGESSSDSSFLGPGRTIKDQDDTIGNGWQRLGPPFRPLHIYPLPRPMSGNIVLDHVHQISMRLHQSRRVQVVHFA